MRTALRFPTRPPATTTDSVDSRDIERLRHLTAPYLESQLLIRDLIAEIERLRAQLRSAAVTA